MATTLKAWFLTMRYVKYDLILDDGCFILPCHHTGIDVRKKQLFSGFLNR